MKKVAIYCRVSTALQEQEKTIESQLEELREICKKQEVQIVKEYVDNGWSGGTLDRPDLDQLRNDAKEGIFERVYFHSHDRLARDATLQAIIVEELEKKEIEIFFHDKPIGDTPEGKFLFRILGAVAEFERAKILERSTRGKLHKARNGIIINGRPPYGYDYIKKTDEKAGYYQINEEEAKTVRLIFDLYLKHQSVRGVARELTDRNIPPRNRWLKAEKWNTSVIAGILRNETYIGTTYYNKYQAIEGLKKSGKKYRKVTKTRKRARDKSEWIPIKVPKVLDNKDIFTTVQELLKKHRRANNQRHQYLLSGGLIKCVECGSIYSGDTSHGCPAYRCTNRIKRFPLEQTCDAKLVNGKRIENAVWNAICEAIMNPEILIRQIVSQADNVAKSNKNLEDARQRYFKERENLNQQKSKLLDIYIQGTISKEEYLNKIKELAQKEEMVNSNLNEIKIKLSQTANRPLLIKKVKYFCKLAKQRLYSFDFQEKYQFLRYLIDEIIFDSKRSKARIIGGIPVTNNEIAQALPVQSGTKDVLLLPINILNINMETN